MDTLHQKHTIGSRATEVITQISQNCNRKSLSETKIRENLAFIIAVYDIKKN
jgi:hypothetical protein